MKKILYVILVCLILIFMLVGFTTKDNQVEQTEQEIIYVKAEKIEQSEQNNEPKVEEVEEVEEIIKTTEEIKLEEFNTNLAEIEYLKKESKEEWFIAYKNLTFEYVEWIGMPITVFDAFTEDEVRLICRAVETETYDQDFDSKVNVACVIFNRIESGKFGDTVTEVITNPNQFAYGRKKITESTILAVMYAYEIEDTTDGCIAFRSGEPPEKWYINKTKTKYWTRQFIDDAGHGFYK